MGGYAERGGHWHLITEGEMRSELVPGAARFFEVRALCSVGIEDEIKWGNVLRDLIVLKL